MPFLSLCSDDHLVTTLRQVFGANILRVPEERVKPLCVIASRDGNSAFRGALQPLLKEKGPAAEILAELATTRMANVAGKHSRKVGLSLGLEILDGFLQGFGIPAAGIAKHFEGADEVSFSFEQVQRTYLDANWLGRILTGRAIDKENPAAAIFFEPNHFAFHVVDSVITSSDFTLSVERAERADFKLNVRALQALVAKANAAVSVATRSSYDVTFQGPRPLAFAFSCVRLYTDPHGKITSMPPAEEELLLGGRGVLPGTSMDLFLYSPDRILLNSAPGMLEWVD